MSSGKKLQEGRIRNVFNQGGDAIGTTPATVATKQSNRAWHIRRPKRVYQCMWGHTSYRSATLDRLYFCVECWKKLRLDNPWYEKDQVTFFDKETEAENLLAIEVEDRVKKAYDRLVKNRMEFQKRRRSGPVKVSYVSQNELPVAVGRACLECGGLVTKGPGPGRWPLRCDTCRGRRESVPVAPEVSSVREDEELAPAVVGPPAVEPVGYTLGPPGSFKPLDEPLGASEDIVDVIWSGL